MPTEAEWEYVAQAGKKWKHAWGYDVDAVAWYSGNAKGETHPVGTKEANAWGIYDLLGNVWEWCNDEFIAVAYSQRSGTVTDPLVYTARVSPRVQRGGSYGVGADRCRLTYRSGGKPQSR